MSDSRSINKREDDRPAVPVNRPVRISQNKAGPADEWFTGSLQSLGRFYEIKKEEPKPGRNVLRLAKGFTILSCRLKPFQEEIAKHKELRKLAGDLFMARQLSRTSRYLSFVFVSGSRTNKKCFANQK